MDMVKAKLSAEAVDALLTLRKFGPKQGASPLIEQAETLMALTPCEARVREAHALLHNWAPAMAGSSDLWSEMPPEIAAFYG